MNKATPTTRKHNAPKRQFSSRPSKQDTPEKFKKATHHREVVLTRRAQARTRKQQQVAPEDTTEGVRATNARRDRQKVDPNRTGALASIEYSSLTVVNKYDNSEDVSLMNNRTVPADIITQSRLDRYCEDDTKEASAYGVQYEQQLDCPISRPKRSHTRNSNDPMNKTSTNSFGTSTRRHFSTNNHQNNNTNNNNNNNNSGAERKSIFDDPVYYSCYNIIGDVKPGWKKNVMDPFIPTSVPTDPFMCDAYETNNLNNESKHENNHI